jgi:hypothetical protein
VDTGALSLQDKTILLAGSGRSGTTWLGNILAANLNYRVIFEPLDEFHVPEAACLPRRAYLRPGCDYPNWAPFILRAFSGQIINGWTTQEGRRPWAWKVLVKEIRANLMLGWAASQFQPRIVYITRHPCSVVLSRLKLKWESNPINFLKQEELVEDYLAPYAHILEGAETEIQKHAVSWAVDNLVPLAQKEQDGLMFVTYEEMYLHPEEKARQLLEAVRVPYTWLTQRAIQQVSSVTRGDSAILQGRSPLTEWQRQLSNEQIAEVLDIVASFEIDLYGASPLPATLAAKSVSQSAEEILPRLIDGMLG